MGTERSSDKNRKDDLEQGEGNKAADRRYREGVRETVNETSEEERARKARSMSKEEQEEARKAEEKGRSRTH